MRRLLALIIGAVAAFAIYSGIHWLSDFLYPLSLDIQSTDRIGLAAVIGGMPFEAKLLTVAAWFCGALGGAWLALRISDRRWSGWAVAGLMLVTALYDIVNLPHPAWMQAAAMLAPIAGGWLAARFHHKPYPGEPLLG